MSSFTTITKDELEKKMKAGIGLQIVNVLGPEYYNLGFIQGSMKIPLSELERRLGELDQSKETVVYCSEFSCDASKKAAEFLASKGFKVHRYQGGIKEWKAAKLPVEGASQAA